MPSGFGKKEPAKPYTDYRQVKRLATSKTFAKLIKEYRDCHDKETAAKKRKAEISGEILPALIAAKQDRVLVDNLRVRRQGGRNSRIDAQILLKKGVSSTIIQDATVTVEYEYVNVEPVPEGGGDLVE